ncbi:uncharacterized protein MONBRDRAFT_13012 [Monosiga brevicollis MX1]|uniref:Uncharacterized protein n=1 Tax=Monosiga brevicollis TaxID=81824 RepID=A9VE12_MONBE|nr:uncharacterized protein MONBRDRAFT_13012 [Monosiga brevicollis MX1]EDQ84229.1 predicted protein [Monosiga brevicollis MX1]|eukprot:XP_001750953.1 hypothetical protein [Monosiga brevicollis MX1]
MHSCGNTHWAPVVIQRCESQDAARAAAADLAHDPSRKARDASLKNIAVLTTAEETVAPVVDEATAKAARSYQMSMDRARDNLRYQATNQNLTDKDEKDCWQLGHTADGQPYYLNLKTFETRTTKPEGYRDPAVVEKERAKAEREKEALARAEAAATTWEEVDPIQKRLQARAAAQRKNDEPAEAHPFDKLYQDSTLTFEAKATPEFKRPKVSAAGDDGDGAAPMLKKKKNRDKGAARQRHRKSAADL